MSDDEHFEEDCADGEVVCEFFGIKIITKNPNIARVLTANVEDIAHLDVREVGNYLREQFDAEEEDDDKTESNYLGETGKKKDIEGDPGLSFINIDPDVENI